MPLQIIRNDITKMRVDAIVNAANTSLLGGGGVDGCIHRAAGPELLAECSTLHGCETGSAKITKGYRLPCKYVIHAVGPRWRDGKHQEQQLLESCYRTSLNLAKENGCQSVAFPLISSGVYGYPKAQALKVAMDTITQFLLDHDMTVYIVVFSKDAFEVSSKLFKDIEAYIDDVYVDERLSAPSESMRMRLQRRYLEKAKATEAEPEECCAPSMASDARLDDMLSQVDESFAQMLIRKIDERHMTDAQCYKRANVDRRLFNKIKNIPDYKPSKQTALAFAIALELDLEKETVKQVLRFAKKYNKRVYAAISNMSIAMERRDFLQQVDCFVCNQQEAGLLFSDDYDHLSPAAMREVLAANVHSANIPCMVVTMGGQGAVYARANGESGVVPAKKVDVIDTTGAGDAFFAGTVIGLTYGKNLPASCEIGSRLAASVISITENVCPRFRPLEFGLDIPVLD